MPETPNERIVAAAMLIVAALLIALVARETTRTGGEPEVSAGVAGALTSTAPVMAPATRAPSPPATATPVPAQPLTSLRLMASGGDSWLTVRADSAEGEVLYAGTLAQGTEVDVKATQFWVRFGGASDLTAWLNGKPLPLRAGTYNALISPDGLQLVAG